MSLVKDGGDDAKFRGTYHTEGNWGKHWRTETWVGRKSQEAEQGRIGQSGEMASQSVQCQH